MTVYADTSFFVSLYLIDSHSSEAQQRLVHGPALWLTPLHRAEWAHAVSQHVFRGKISAQEAQQVYKSFEHDRNAGAWLYTGFPEKAFETCVALARVHVARLGARTLDTLHVASAVELKAGEFWTFDERQAKLAEAAGLTTCYV